MNRIKIFLAALFAAIVVTVTAAPASQAYLHVANAQQECLNDHAYAFDSYSDTFIGPGNNWLFATAGSYIRISDSQVVVKCGFKGNSGWGTRPPSRPSQGEVISYIIGTDGNAAPYFGGGYPMWKYLGPEPVGPCCGFNWQSGTGIP